MNTVRIICSHIHMSSDNCDAALEWIFLRPFCVTGRGVISNRFVVAAATN